MADQPCAKVAYTQSQHAKKARAVYRQDSPTKKSRKRVEKLWRCQHTWRARLLAMRLTRKLRNRYQERKSLTPYNCGKAGWFAVPCAIVACESRFNPRADNGSHYGYYQEQYSYLGGDRSVANQHRVAASLWSGGSGAHHWVCKA